MRPDCVLRKRITELEDQVFDLKFELRDIYLSMRLPLQPPKEWNVSTKQKEILGVLYMATGLVTKKLLYRMCYYHKVNPPDDVTINTHIHNLRKKLKEHGVSIITHRAEGFSLSKESKDILTKYCEPCVDYNKELNALDIK